MDRHSEFLLKDVHPDLVRVLELASQSPQAFEVVQGLRTLSAEKEAVLSGHSETLNSRHLPNKDGLSMAVDVAAIVGGKISWAVGNEFLIYGQIAKQVLDAASILNIQVTWGGTWVTLRDFGHFELSRSTYP